jgi:arsenate reductase
MKSILVLCSRNSVRSQLAEAYLKFYSGHKADISSAGIKEMGIHPYTIQVMEEDNLDLSEHYSKSFKVFKNRKFDILVTVCDEAYKNLPRSIKKKRSHPPEHTGPRCL